MALSKDTIERITELLGRAPRGLEDVACYGPQAEPRVIRVASLVDDKPFPTLFWLIDPQLSYRIDREEARGLIAKLQAEIDADESLREAMRRDHLAHIALRERFLKAEDRQRMAALGYLDVLSEKGIGGIADFTRIRCLHTWYAAHLIEPNTVGRLLDRHWENYPPEG